MMDDQTQALHPGTTEAARRLGGTPYNGQDSTVRNINC